jgi:hypothetical protein
MTAIETEYNGILFRSRLEARWAIFFDAFNLDWVYEPECFILSNNQKYTPDFYLPNLKLYIEIKPNFDWINNNYHKNRYELFTKDLLILSDNFPNFSVNLLYHYDELNKKRIENNIVFIPNHPKYGDYWFTPYELGSFEDEFNNEYQKEINLVKQYRFYK